MNVLGHFMATVEQLSKQYKACQPILQHAVF